MLAAIALVVAATSLFFGQTLPRVPDAVALRHLVHTVPPVYPAEARFGRISGLVRIQVTIDETGSVRQARVIRGHPLLAPAAVNAVKGWKFQPFEVNGNALAVLADVDVPFSLSGQEQQFYETYLPALHEAEEELSTGNYGDAEKHALIAKKAAEDAGPYRWSSVADAVSLLASVRMAQKKYPDAESLYRDALKLHRSRRKASDPEVGQSLSDLGTCLMAEGKSEESSATLSKAVDILRQRAADARSDESKRSYRRTVAVDSFNLARLANSRGDKTEVTARCREAVGNVDALQSEQSKKAVDDFCSPVVENRGSH